MPLANRLFSAGIQQGWQGKDGVETGLDMLDRHLPGRGFAVAGLHEFVWQWDGAATAFVLFLAGRFYQAAGRQKPVFWARASWMPDHGQVMPLAGDGLGLPVEALLMTVVTKQEDGFWAAEEALKSRAMAAVICESRQPDDLALRRLQLAAERSRTPVLLLRPAPVMRGQDAGFDDLATRLRCQPSPALTRWQVVPVSVPDQFVTGWELRLLRCRGAESAAWRAGIGRRSGLLEALP